MADAPPTTTAPEAVTTQPPVVVKKYANRRLYNTETSSYITLDNLAEMIRAGRDFVVYDAKSGEDITRGVLTQIIVEEESKGSAMLPTGFLRQLIGFYGGNLQGVVPNYLEHAMSTFARQQQQMRQVVQQTFGPFIPAGVEEMSRQNMAMFENAMSIFNPFGRSGDPARASGGAAVAVPGTGESDPAVVDPGVVDKTPAAQGQPELAALQHEVDSLRAQLAIARAEAVIRTSLPGHEPPGAAEPGLAAAPEPAPVNRPARPLAVARKQRAGRTPD